MIARQSLAVCDENDEDSKSSLVGAKDETRTTTINMGCLIFACTFTYKGLKLLGEQPLDYNTHHAASPVVDNNNKE